MSVGGISDFKFRGNWVRPEIFDMVANGEISVKEAWLLLIIDNLVEGSGKDCFASNAYLGALAKVQDRQVKVMLANLKQHGLLIQTGFDGRKRFLTTAWSRLKKGEGQTCRKMHVGHADSNTSDVLEDARITNTVNNKDNKIILRPRAAAVKDGRWKKLAEKLHAGISRVRTVNKNSKTATWGASFRALHERDGIPVEKVQEVLDWYCQFLKQTGDQISTGNKYVPIAYTGQKFREKFDGLEAAMHRQGGGTRAQKVKVREGDVRRTSKKELDDLLAM